MTHASEPLVPALDPGAAIPGGRRIEVAGEALSYDEFRALARDLAGRLATSTETWPSARPDAPVAVLARPELDTVLAVVGALLAGRVVVPVPADAGESELAHILGDSRAACWVGPRPEPGSPAARAGTGLPVVPASRAADGADAASLASTDARDPHAPAMILYTSGTTGSPKGVQLSRAAIAHGLDALAQAWAWTGSDTLAHGLPLFHVHGLVVGCLGPLRLGGSLIHTGRPSPSSYAAAAAAGATMFFGVPTIWHRVAADASAAAALAGARVLVSGSAPLPVPVFERMRDLTGHAMVERYGMTETLLTVANWVDRPDRPRLPGHVGWPLPGIETRLRDEDGRAVPADGQSVGRLEVRGPTLFTGYLNRPEATAESFTDDGWFVTGDVATIGPDGNHRIVGRESVDLIKSGGYRIGAGEIETFLLGLPGVAECAVVGVPDDDLGQRIVAYVVASPAGPAPQGPDLADAVAEGLSVHKRPREVRFVGSLPRNEMGKVQKKALLADL